MHRIIKHVAFIVILVAVAFAPHFSTAHATFSRVALPGSWIADVTFCTDGFSATASGDLGSGVTTTVSVLGASPASKTGAVLTFAGPGSGSGSALFGWLSPQRVGKYVSVTLDRSENGASLTGDTLRACQTAFVIDNNGGYGEIFIMGGWINLAYTTDVPEDYGQPGGSPVAPGCVGR
jgi:hypothetical protein